MQQLFDKYPYINSLRSLVPEELIIEEIGAKAAKFEDDLNRAKKSIDTVNLNRIFPAELESGKITIENFLGHWGNVSIEELCKICLIVKFISPKRLLEIGTYNGMTTLQMALNCPPDSTVYTLDLPDELSATLELSKIDQLVSKIFKDRFGTKTGSYFSNRNDVRIIQKLGDSSTFNYDELGQDKLDLIFIDAAHDYANKKIDSENAFRMIANKGVIIWHNYNDVTCPDVTAYLADISVSRKIYHLRNTTLAVHYHI